MNNKGLPALESVLHAERKDDIPLDDPSDESYFVQAMEYGSFHEDEPDWPSIAAALTRQQLASLFPAVCRKVLNSSPQLAPELMQCYRLLEAWQNDNAEASELTASLALVRRNLFTNAIEDCSIWWMELVFVMQLIESGVAVHSQRKLLPIMDAYENFGYQFDEFSSRPRKGR